MVTHPNASRDACEPTRAGAPARGEEAGSQAVGRLRHTLRWMRRGPRAWPPSAASARAPAPGRTTAPPRP
ncbi:hypothetical protein ACFSM7_12210 [Clavibacter michiganensis subsp. tessellarius]|uniref:hypothetical protein n=1 Tax=Clavibacter tessellarius TaxID=31965 RepID=UPI003626E079